MKMKRLLCALLIGLALASNPVLMRRLPPDSGLSDALKWAGSFVLIPGALVGWIASGLRFDDLNMTVVGIANLIFYSGLVYFLLGLWGKHRDKTRQQGPMAG